MVRRNLTNLLTYLFVESGNYCRNPDGKKKPYKLTYLLVDTGNYCRNPDGKMKLTNLITYL